MAGILANSATVTMTSSTADATSSGYVAGEQIVLTTTPAPAGATYEWAIAKPSGSALSCTLTDATAAGPAITPDVAGYYTVTCTVNGTTAYVIRCSVVAVAVTTWTQAARLQPVAEASVSTPASGSSVFHSLSRDRLVAKSSAGTVRDLEPGKRTGTFTLAGGAGTIADTSTTATTTVACHCTAAVARGNLVFTVTPSVGFAIASDNGGDGSTYRYALIG